MVGELRWPARPLTPVETVLPSVNARAGSWQVLQATVPSTDKRPSKNSFSPRAIFSGLCGFSAGTAARVTSTGTPTCFRDLGLASAPAVGIGRATGACACAADPKFQLSGLPLSRQRAAKTEATTTVIQSPIRFVTLMAHPNKCEHCQLPKRLTDDRRMLPDTG